MKVYCGDDTGKKRQSAAGCAGDSETYTKYITEMIPEKSVRVRQVVPEILRHTPSTSQR